MNNFETINNFLTTELLIFLSHFIDKAYLIIFNLVFTVKLINKLDLIICELTIL